MSPEKHVGDEPVLVPALVEGRREGLVANQHAVLVGVCLMGGGGSCCDDMPDGSHACTVQTGLPKNTHLHRELHERSREGDNTVAQ